jgi:pimeloyl-ACP methyl ester carboxylesterase
VTAAVRLPAPPWPATTVELPGTAHQVVSVRSTPPTPGAEPAVLVHGLGGSNQNWTDLMALLADRLAARAPDLPGFGDSPPPPDHDYGLPTHVRAVVRLIESDGRGPVHLLGNSLGGAVAVVVAARRPDLVRTLTLVSPALPDLFRPGLARAEVAAVAAPLLGPYLSGRLARMSPEERVRGTLSLVYADPSTVPPDQLALAVAEVERRSTLDHTVEALAASTRGLLRAFLVGGPASLWRLASTVTAPTLVVYGRQDRLVSWRVAPKAKAAFPDATVVVLERTGHVAQIEHPRLVARFVRRHLDRAAAG